MMYLAVLFLLFLSGCDSSQFASIPSQSTTAASTPVASPSPSVSPSPSASPSASPTMMKWHPGHYGLSLSVYTPNNVTDIHNDWTAILNSDSRFVGVNGFYDWYHLEPITQGVYDFTPIDNDIAWLNTHFPGKKMMIEIWTRDFSGTQALPTTPQDPNYTYTKVPDYIVKGAFTGSGGVSGVTWNSNGRLAAYWSAPVLARLQALDAALAARYDSNPTVEVIRYDEYSAPAPSSGAPALGWSNAASVSSWKSFHSSMATHWKTTNRICMANWPSDATGSVDTGLLTFLKNISVGWGGPDVMPSVAAGGPGETWGAQLAAGAGGSFGATDSRGAIPLVYEAENAGYAITVPNLETYAYNTLKATHLVWLYNPTNMGTASWTAGAGVTPWKTTSPNNSKNYAGVLDTLQANSFRIHSSCPTVYNGQCNSN